MKLFNSKSLKFPAPLILLIGCIALAAMATDLIPAGMLDRVFKNRGQVTFISN